MRHAINQMHVLSNSHVVQVLPREVPCFESPLEERDNQPVDYGVLRFDCMICSELRGSFLDVCLPHTCKQKKRESQTHAATLHASLAFICITMIIFHGQLR
eukprot:gnl/MRDRNA2_/MRDRNA2_468275_c0_seq1.p1 gnl/MRDRNA2_/MRDRNA2_468275_c0~~gnl/MRDRNA2_/MRDRNA2_468275_c0_seq1.p1  ORF type:complete len:101 (-),score=5.06 gnl/MRDRNA2_/MRDRNA2_468275_c0_seq1:79-381(-)